MKIGILGGTYNPPHLGHLVLGEEVRQACGLDKVLFIPTNMPPHKEFGLIEPLHRFNMVNLAIKKNAFFQSSDLEIKRGGVSYTIDTVKELKQEFSRDDLYLIAGSDLANYFSTWKDFGSLKKIAKIIVAVRKEYPLRESDGFITVQITNFGISSSRIRDMIKAGKSIRYFVVDSVAGYIEKNKLYT